MKAIDPRSTTSNIIATTFDFSDRFGTPDGEARGNSPPAQLGGQISYAFPTLGTNSLGQTAYAQYDYHLGRAIDAEDANQIKSSGFFDDPLDRPTEILADVIGGLPYSKTRFIYDALNRTITSESDQITVGDFAQRGLIKYDGLGRTIRQASYEGDTGSANTWTIVDTEFDGLGRAKQASNPFRDTDPLNAAAPPSGTWTITGYDALSRVLTVTTPDNAVVTTSYDGARVLVTDQAGKQRISKTDGLGRLIDVWEIRTTDAVTGTEPVTFPNHPEVAAGYRTRYSYDALDDLTQVTQQIGTSGTTQTRSFVYDRLKRLTSAFNPESGTVSYTYDENSNLKTKTDSRVPAVTITYGYDALNRITSRAYSDMTPAVAYTYDAQQLPTGAPGAGVFDRGHSTGRLVAVTYGGTSAGNYTGYDRLGRASVSLQQTDSQNYRFTYEYNLASQMTTETYPSGRAIATAHDAAGRLSQVSGTKTGEQPKTYASQFSYAAHGAVAAMKLGNGKWEHTTFNNRLQPTLIGLGTSISDSSVLRLDYGYGTTNNNGNVLSQKITAPGLTLNQCYGYDSLNRLATAEERSGGTNCAGAQQWKQAFIYDRYGNRNFDVANTTPNVFFGVNPTINQANNRFAAGQNYGYDGAGNLTSEPATAVNGIVYDAENRQMQYTKTGQQTNHYSYDGDGRRVKKIDNNGTTVFVYNAGGQLIAEYTPGTPPGGATSYLASDHLGSTRVVMKADGSVARHDYLPFGEEIVSTIGGRGSVAGYGTPDSTRQRFTQKERDIESGLDYFLSRYYSSAQGRFTSADLAGPDISNPQTLNKYRYGLNNPLRYIDPDGAQEKESWTEGLRRYLSSLFESKAKVRTEEDARPQQVTNPYGLTEEKLVQYHLQGLAQGSRTLFNVVSTLDPTGGSAVMQGFMDRDKAGVGLGMAGMVGGPALSKIFGVGSKALTSGELLPGRLGAAEVAAQFSKSGRTLVADIVGVFGEKSQGLASSTKALFNSIMGFAKQEGLSEVRVQAVAVVNKDLEQRLIKHGWQKTTVIVDGENVSAYTRTFQVR